MSAPENTTTSYLALDLPAIAHASHSHPATTPIVMLNLFRYRPRALYAPEHAHLATPCTGEEAMNKYRALIRSVLPPGTTLQFSGRPIAHVVAPAGEAWDLVALMRYESLEGFRRMVESREYREEVMPHRVAGLADARLIMMEDGA